MREGKFGIEGGSLLGVLFGNGIELLPEQHARREEITGRRVFRHVEHSCERFTSLGIILGLDVADAENVRGVDVSAGIPGLHSLQQRNGIGWMAAQIIRKPEQLRGLVVAGIGYRGFLQIFNSFGVVALLVMSGPEFQVEPLQTRVAGFERMQFGDGVVEFALLDQLTALHELGSGGRCGLRGAWHRWIWLLREAPWTAPTKKCRKPEAA